ncbi:hypothetical protein QL231_29925 [Bacillus bombysepticus]|nr:MULTISPECIES: hypothetical protein [Bacillus]MDJ0284738.1 hypothetical protein [Bacillus bombysepticus]MDJ0298359.1 hypothetical protein [Bacillus bombysepticus]MDJ0304190.1 hypothetical protein [Bacillus bombysepticus]MEC0116805.1 hypothetical protein [Bacillus cereus]MEC0165417.1 hypothetical protein [Bacillus cereus]
MRKFKKCKTCNGRGFIFKKSVDVRSWSYRYIDTQVTCIKCFGKGVK